MGFKDTVAADIDNVFFNEAEFADEAIIDGKPVPIILDDDILNGKMEAYSLGQAEGEQLIFIKEKDMNHFPQPGEQITIKGEKWYVKLPISNMGVYELRITRNQITGEA
jgi:hypothetical protein